MAQLWRINHSIWVTTQFSYVHIHICSIYILSMGKTWSDLFKIMCCIVLLLPPIKPNGPSCLSYLPKHIPPQPNPTQLKYSPPHLYKYDSWLRNRAQTAPPDCPQTRLKSHRQTTPQTDPVYLPQHHHIIVWRKCIYSNIFEYFLIQIVSLFYLFRIFDAITSIALKLLWVSDTPFFFEFTVSTFYKET